MNSIAIKRGKRRNFRIWLWSIIAFAVVLIVVLNVSGGGGTLSASTTKADVASFASTATAKIDELQREIRGTTDQAHNVGSTKAYAVVKSVDTLADSDNTYFITTYTLPSGLPSNVRSALSSAASNYGLASESYKLGLDATLAYVNDGKPSHVSDANANYAAAMQSVNTAKSFVAKALSATP